MNVQVVFEKFFKKKPYVTEYFFCPTRGIIFVKNRFEINYYLSTADDICDVVFMVDSDLNRILDAKLRKIKKIICRSHVPFKIMRSAKKTKQFRFSSAETIDEKIFKKTLRKIEAVLLWEVPISQSHPRQLRKRRTVPIRK